MRKEAFLLASMNRKEYLQKTLALGICPFALSTFFSGQKSSASPLMDEQTDQLKMEKEFIQHWLSDLLGTMEKMLDRETLVKLMEGCGKACYQRYQFKQDIASQGKGNVDKLIEAYRKNFEIWREGDLVHIRYGEVSDHCYCPAANYRAPMPNDIHCECTRMTHQTIFETALGHPIKVKVVESLRRGGKTCHFVAYLN